MKTHTINEQQIRGLLVKFYTEMVGRQVKPHEVQLILGENLMVYGLFREGGFDEDDGDTGHSDQAWRTHPSPRVVGPLRGGEETGRDSASG